jgi:hemoglobin
MRDIETTEDIELLMHAFYAKAMIDPLIGHYFTEVAPLDLETHIPVITRFWESVVFDKNGYQGNVMQIHKHIHEKSAFQDIHFQRWLTLFTATVDELFAGDKAFLIKQRAESIATVMRIKLVSRES